MKTPEKIVNQAMESLWSFQQDKRKDDIYPPSGPIQHKWQSPPLGMMKVNTDVAIFEQETAIWLGALVRNKLGEVVVAKARRSEGMS